MVLGWGETPDLAEPLAYEFTKGEHAIIDDISDIFTVADVMADPESYRRLFNESLVITHSAGIMAVESAAQIMTLSGVEPTRLPRVAQGALMSGFIFNQHSEPGISKPPFISIAKEIARHPYINAKIIHDIGGFSTAKHLSLSADRFPEGRMMFTYAGDEYGFTRMDTMLFALAHGVHVDVFGVLHNTPIHRPSKVTREINGSLNR